MHQSDEHLARPQEAPAKTATALVRSLILVLDAVLEGHGGHPATKRIVQAAIRLSAALKEMRHPQ